MDISTVQRVLALIEPQLSDNDYQNIRNILRKEYVMDEMARTEEEIKRRTKKCPVGELPVLQKAKLYMQCLDRQLTALDTL